MLHRFSEVLKNLVIYKDNMKKNINLYGGIVFSQKVLLKLLDKGYTREEAYQIVQEHALNALNGSSFKQALTNDKRVTDKLSVDEIDACFDIADYLSNIDYIFKKFE
mgnify:CR=1 FL=1